MDFYKNQPGEEENIDRLSLNVKSRTKVPNVDETFRFDGPPDATVTVGGRHYIYFGGDGYLGLQANPEVLAATCEAVLRHGVSCATSRRHYTSSPVWEVEQLAARIFETQNAFYCSSEEKTFETLLESILGSFERVYIDEACSPFITNAVEKTLGGRMPLCVIRHQDTKQLEHALKRLEPGQRPLFITEGVFPVLGTIAPIDKYMTILGQYRDASILIDDSSAFGVLGRCGRGTLEHFNLPYSRVNQTQNDRMGSDVFSEPDFESPEFDMPDVAETVGTNRKSEPPVHIYWMTSLAKAIGGYGGMIPGSDLFIERLAELASRTGAGVPPSPLAAATGKSLELSFTSSKMRGKLARNTRYFKRGLKRLGFSIDDNPVPLVPIRIGSSQNMRRIQQMMNRRQILISYIPRQKNLGSQGALRVTIFATHNKRMLDSLLQSLAEAVLK